MYNFNKNRIYNVIDEKNRITVKLENKYSISLKKKKM